MLKLARRAALLAVGYGRAEREHAIRRSPFYRVYPFHFPTPIESVDFRGLIDGELRVFYNRVPKAANTSVVFSLAKLKTGKEPTTMRVKRSFAKPSDLSEQQVIEFASYFKFTFVREPYSRVLSAYLSKIARGLIKLKRARLSAKPTFSEFCRYLAEGGLYENAHWAPQTTLMLIPLSTFDFIGKVESIDSDLRVVLSRLGAPDPASVAMSYSSFVGRARERAGDYYDPDSRKLIAKLYQHDFDTFGYPI
jgi:hypothetical protein